MRSQVWPAANLVRACSALGRHHLAYDGQAGRSLHFQLPTMTRAIPGGRAQARSKPQLAASSAAFLRRGEIRCALTKTVTAVPLVGYGQGNPGDYELEVLEINLKSPRAGARAGQPVKDYYARIGTYALQSPAQGEGRCIQSA